MQFLCIKKLSPHFVCMALDSVNTYTHMLAVDAYTLQTHT